MKPLSFRSISIEANCADKMPKKTIRKFKKAARQQAKREIRKQVD